MTGRFITFEGGEGTGKSTQARRLAERLAADTPTAGGKPREVVAKPRDEAGGKRREVVVTREPGGTQLAESIRDLILSQKPLEPQAEFLLFAAARAEHLTAVIKPALQRDAWVICDRFIDSTRVYQGDIFKVDANLISAIEHLTVAPWYPDLTLMLDLPPSIGLARAAERGALSRFDAARMETHAALRAGFLRIARAEPQRCVVIDANADEATVADRVWQAVSARLPDDLQGLA